MDAIKRAIEEVRHQGDTVTVFVSCSIDDVEAYVERLGYGVDYVELGDGLYDMWGWSEVTLENVDDWRIRVQCGVSDKMAVQRLKNEIGDTTPFTDEWWQLFEESACKLDRDGYDWSNRYPEVDENGVIVGICEGDSEVYRSIGPDGFAMVRSEWAENLEQTFGDVWDHSNDYR